MLTEKEKEAAENVMVDILQNREFMKKLLNHILDASLAEDAGDHVTESIWLADELQEFVGDYRFQLFCEAFRE